MKDSFQDDFRSDDHCGDCARLAVQHHAKIRDSIETGVQQQIRDEPLESAQTELLGQGLCPPETAQGFAVSGVASDDQTLVCP